MCRSIASVTPKGSYTLAFDFLKPESIYTVYVLAYDENGLPTGLKSLTCSTGAVADDPFTVTTTHVGTTTLKYNVTAKDASVKYCTFATGYDYYQRWQLEGRHQRRRHQALHQHVVHLRLLVWRELADHDEVRPPRGNAYEGDGNHLMWDARQVVITFGMDDDGNLVTPIQVDSIHTNAPTPVDMDIPLTVLSNEWGDQQIKAAPTTNTPYFITMQPAAYVDLYKTDAALLRALCYEADNINPTDLARTRDEDLREGLWEFRVRKDVDTDYYIIAVGLDEGAPATRAFKTKITVLWRKFLSLLYVQQRKKKNNEKDHSNYRRLRALCGGHGPETGRRCVENPYHRRRGDAHLHQEHQEHDL